MPTTTKQTTATRQTTANLGQLAKMSGKAPATITAIMEAARLDPAEGCGKTGRSKEWNLFEAMRAIFDATDAKAEGRSAMDAKLDEDRQFTQLKRLQMAGELVDRTEAERVISQVAAITSNVVDAWGLDRVRRNELMERIGEGVRQAWRGDREDGDDEE